jgi:hypothetical protein
MPNYTAGALSMRALLEEEITKHKLFERFVLGFYRVRVGERSRPKVSGCDGPMRSGV